MKIDHIFSLVKNVVTNSCKFLSSLRYQNISWISLSSVQDNCLIEDFVKISSPSRLANVKVGYGTYISKNAEISNTSIGKFCSIGPNVLCGWGIHPLDGLSTSPMFYSTLKQNGITFSKNDKVIERKSITIGNDVFIGANVTILDGVEVGHGAVIAAGSVVNSDVPAYAITGGVPAKVIRYRFDEEKIDQLLKISWWNWSLDKLPLVEQYFFNIDEFIRLNKS